MKLMLFLSHNGILSRRKAFDAIKAGAVQVNGRINLEPSTDVDPARDKVLFHDRLVNDRIFEYIMLNKPEGHVTSCERQFGEATVMDILPKDLKHLRPVGRLDKDTEGLLLFTNDGELANHMAHPSFDVNKTYLVRVRGKIAAAEVGQLEAGVMIEGKKTAPAAVALIKSSDDVSEFQITIHEGRKRQVRMMADAINRPVVYLSRLSQGPLELGGLPRGEYRRLSEEEVMVLKRIKRSAASKAKKPEAKSFSAEPKYVGRRGRGEFNRDQRLLREEQLREKQRVSDERRPVSRPAARPQDPRRRPYVPKEGGRPASRDERQRSFSPREGRPASRSEDSGRRPPRPEYSSREGHRSSPRSGERPAAGPKPLFSSNSEKRKFSSTREWHSDSDVHAPSNAPKTVTKPAFSKPQYGKRPDDGARKAYIKKPFRKS
ncbi:MAG: pseudouridine synthase [Candidatus Omnitrophota bacterium]